MAVPSWILGVVLIIIGSLGNNLGNNLVSLGHSEAKEKKRKESCADEGVDLTNNGLSQSGGEVSELTANMEQPKAKNWRVIGTVVFVLGNLFTFASFGFGAQSLLASLESIQFVSNLVFAKYCHNEPVTIRMMLATVSIVVGNVLVVIFAQHDATLYHSTGMIHLYVVNSAYHGYLVAAAVVCFITNYVYQKYHHSRVKLGVLLFKHSFMEPFCYAMSSAIVGTQAVLNSKCMSMLIQVTARGEKNEFESWYIWFILATWIIMVAFWLHRLDKGLELFPPLFIIPVMQVFFVFFAIMCGGIYFEEFNKFNTSQYIGFCFGVVMILGGVYGLAPTDMVLHTPDEVVVPISRNVSEKKNNNGAASAANGEDDLEAGSSLLKEQQQKALEMVERPTTGQSEDGHHPVLDAPATPLIKTKPGSERQTQPNEDEINLYAAGKNSPVHVTTAPPHLTVDPVTGFTVANPNVVLLAPIDLMSEKSTNSKKNRKVVKRPVTEE